MRIGRDVLSGGQRLEGDQFTVRFWRPLAYEIQVFGSIEWAGVGVVKEAASMERSKHTRDHRSRNQAKRVVTSTAKRVADCPDCVCVFAVSKKVINGSTVGSERWRWQKPRERKGNGR